MIHTLLLYAALQVCRVQNYTLAVVTPPAKEYETLYVAPSGWGVPPNPVVITQRSITVLQPGFEGMVAIQGSDGRIETAIIAEGSVPDCDVQTLLSP